MTARRRRILLTNDDGIDAPGMTAMREALVNHPQYEVLVVAPFRERSGSGCGLSLTAEMRVEERRNPDGSIWGYAVDGLPADTVKFAVTALGGYRPDLVLSGINPGANVGNSVFYSGTVGCAIEAAFFGLRAMATSLWRRAGDDGIKFETGAFLAVEMIPWLLECTWSPRTFWNFNLPNTSLDEIKGTRFTHQGTSFYTDEFRMQREDGDAKIYRNVGKNLVQSPEAHDSDDRMMERGYASMTLLSTDMTVPVPRAAQEALEAGWNKWKARG